MSIIGQVTDLAFNPAEPRDSRGRWVKGGAATIEKIVQPIGDEGARGNSRAVTGDEFQQLAAEGRDRLRAVQSAPWDTTGLDSRWPEVKQRSYTEVQKPWGGATIDPRSGDDLPQGADKYAMSIKPSGLDTTSVPEHASAAEFSQAMDIARDKYGRQLAKGGSYLGVFHDDDLHRIDIDPVTVLDSLRDVETIGAYTHAIGGAYHFASGDGFWPPHVPSGATLSAETTHWAGPGQWHSHAVSIQQPHDEPEDQQLAGSVIGQALDLAGGWRDAWRHELRGAHGQWVRGLASQAMLGEGYPGQFGERMLSYWRLEKDDNVKQSLEQASAAYAAGDYKQTVERLRKAASAGTAHADRYTQLARIIEKHASENEQLKSVAEKLAAKGAPVSVKLLDGGHQAWDGTAEIMDRDAFADRLADIDWQGHMRVREDVARSLQDAMAHPSQPVEDPAAFAVIEHELFHDVLPEGHPPSAGELDYQNPSTAMIEEGFNELATIHHAADFFRQVGVGDRKTAILSLVPATRLPDIKPEAVYAVQTDIGAIRKRLGDEGGYPGASEAYNAAIDADRALWSVETNGRLIARKLMEARHYTRDPSIKEQIAGVLKKIGVDDPEITTDHATMAQYAERVNNPGRIHNSDAWGHYGQQTSDALDWVEAVAGDEGLKFGTPQFTRRVVELSDEINREGPDGKIAVMARQLARNIPGGSLPPGELAELEQEIRDQWTTETGAQVHHQVRKGAQQRLAALTATR